MIIPSTNSSRVCDALVGEAETGNAGEHRDRGKPAGTHRGRWAGQVLPAGPIPWQRPDRKPDLVQFGEKVPPPKRSAPHFRPRRPPDEIDGRRVPAPNFYAKLSPGER